MLFIYKARNVSIADLQDFFFQIKGQGTQKNGSKNEWSFPGLSFNISRKNSKTSKVNQ